MQSALEEPNVCAVVEKLLQRNIEVTTDPNSPPGCFMVQGALACSDAADPLKIEMAKRRSQLEALLRKRFVRAVEEGDLPANCESGGFGALCNDGIQWNCGPGSGGC